MNQIGSVRQTTRLCEPDHPSESACLAERPGLARMDEVVAAALDSTPVGLIVLNADMTLRLCTRTARDLLGRRQDCAAGLPVEAWLSDCQALGAEALPLFSAALDAAGPEPQEVLLELRGSAPKSLTVDIRAAGALGWVISLHDVTETRQTQNWLLEHVSTDPVTGLWNRQHFMLMLQDGLTRAALDPGLASPCVLLIGLKGFKRMTEAMGPGAGDALLRVTGDRLAGLAAEDDMLARFSADEFALALAHPGDRLAIAAQCERLNAALSRPCVVDGLPVMLEVQIGVALAREDGHTPEELTSHAGLALQAATSATASGLRFFDPGLTERAHLRRALESDLRHALGREEFELFYQAQVDIHHGCITGLEALIRWRCPKRGLVPPGIFIGLAEQIGLIVPIGEWVLHEACREAMRWPEEVRVAVNASPLQFETGHFARTVAEALAATGLPARRLEVEITENLLLHETGIVLEALAALQALGVRLVLDDFGTGYASLSQLSRFKFDKIKIDRSFVSPDDLSVKNSAIIRSISALGSGLGIPTTAEGVETAAQLAQIKADGCTCVQGYFFSRPVPASDVADVIRRLHRPEPVKPRAGSMIEPKGEQQSVSRPLPAEIAAVGFTMMEDSIPEMRLP